MSFGRIHRISEDWAYFAMSPPPMSGLKVLKNNGLGLDLSAKVLYLNGFNRKLLVVKEIAPGIYAGASRFFELLPV